MANLDDRERRHQEAAVRLAADKLKAAIKVQDYAKAREQIGKALTAVDVLETGAGDAG